MAIGFSLANNYAQPSSEGFGGVDLMGAISKGMTLGMQPRQQSEALLQTMLANKIKGAEARYAPQMQEANLNYKLGQIDLQPWEKQYKQAMINKASQPTLNNYEKALEGYNRVVQQYGEGSQQAQQAADYVSRIAQGSQGITVLDPKTGQPMVQIGGSGRGGGLKPGSNFVSGGNQYQLPTTGIQTQLQNRVIGQKIVQPYLDKIVENLPQFQSSWVKGLSKAAGLANRWIPGSDFDLPSQQQTGTASLGLAAEGMLRQFGLNATTKNLQRMEQILTPGEDESKDGYIRRANKQAVDFLNQALLAQEQLTGIQTNTDNNLTTENNSTAPTNSVNLDLNKQTQFDKETQKKKPATYDEIKSLSIKYKISPDEVMQLLAEHSE